jgi:5-methylcytosine-specific restriction protein A
MSKYFKELLVIIGGNYMASRDNIFEYNLGEKWATNYFAGKKNQGYIIKTRAHKKRKEEDITYNKENVLSLSKQLKKLSMSDNSLIIVRTYEENSEYLPLWSYIILVSHELIEQFANKNKSLTFYPRRHGNYGIDYWEKTRLVKYYPIAKSDLISKSLSLTDNKQTVPNGEMELKESTKRNPTWHREELILALELYFRHHPLSINKNHHEVINLSNKLNSLAIHTEKPDVKRFRNPNGVYMKMCNYLRFDPSYSGKGLSAGGKLEEDIWNEFAHDQNKLIKIAEMITLSAEINNIVTEFNVNPPKATIQQFIYELSRNGERELENSLLEMSDEHFNEYINKLDSNAEIQIKEGLIKIRKYNKKIIDDLKERCEYSCQICGFNSMTEYGESIVEAHHIEEFSITQNNKPKNILIVCPNHHRLIHKAKGRFDRVSFKVIYANNKVESLKIISHLL